VIIEDRPGVRSDAMVLHLANTALTEAGTLVAGPPGVSKMSLLVRFLPRL
jgi:hypothetical protein